MATVEEVFDRYEALCDKYEEFFDKQSELIKERKELFDEQSEIIKGYEELFDRQDETIKKYEALCDRKDKTYDELAKAYDELLMTVKDNGESENEDDFDYVDEEDWMQNVEVNEEQLQATQEQEQKQAVANRKIYAHGMLSREDLISTEGDISNVFDKDIVASYIECKNDFDADKHYFTTKEDGLYSSDGKICYIRVPNHCTYVVLDDFYRFLVSFGSDWTFANGHFASAMNRRLNS